MLTIAECLARLRVLMAQTPPDAPAHRTLADTVIVLEKELERQTTPQSA